MKRIVIWGASLMLALVVGACAAPAATPAPPVVQTVVVPQTVAVPQTVVVKETAVPPTAVPPTAVPVPPTPLAQLPADALHQKGKLLICSDFPYPPMEFYDENGNPTGADIELGQAVAKRLGVQAEFVNSIFDTIIAAVTGGKCDVIMSSMNITPDRHKQISWLAYLKNGQSMVVAKGNPKNINAPLDTCGTSVAAESGTTEADYINGTGDYKGKGLIDQCKAAGKQPVISVVTQKDSDALLQLQSGKVTVYFADTPVAAYYVVQSPDQFQLVGAVIEPIPVGIGVPCGQADCTSAPLTPLGQAVKAALLNMMSDGTYTNILTKYKLTDGALTPADVGQ